MSHIESISEIFPSASELVDEFIFLHFTGSAFFNPLEALKPSEEATPLTRLREAVNTVRTSSCSKYEAQDVAVSCIREIFGLSNNYPETIQLLRRECFRPDASRKTSITHKDAPLMNAILAELATRHGRIDLKYLAPLKSVGSLQSLRNELEIDVYDVAKNLDADAAAFFCKMLTFVAPPKKYYEAEYYKRGIQAFKAPHELAKFLEVASRDINPEAFSGVFSFEWSEWAPTQMDDEREAHAYLGFWSDEAKKTDVRADVSRAAQKRFQEYAEQYAAERNAKRTEEEAIYAEIDELGYTRIRVVLKQETDRISAALGSEYYVSYFNETQPYYDQILTVQRRKSRSILIHENGLSLCAIGFRNVRAFIAGIANLVEHGVTGYEELQRGCRILKKLLEKTRCDVVEFITKDAEIYERVSAEFRESGKIDYAYYELRATAASVLEPARQRSRRI